MLIAFTFFNASTILSASAQEPIDTNIQTDQNNHEKSWFSIWPFSTPKKTTENNADNSNLAFETEG